MKPHSTTSWLRVYMFLQFFLLVKADVDPFGYTRDGCYSGLAGFVSMGQSPSMSSYYCMNLCSEKGYSVAAATNPGVCYCGNSIPGTQLPSSDCNFPCPAYPQEPCGGSNGAYNVFHIGNDVSTASPVGTSSSPASTSSPNTDATSSTAQPTSDTTSLSAATANTKTSSPTASQSSNDSAGGTSATSKHSVQTSSASATVINSATTSSPTSGTAASSTASTTASTTSSAAAVASSTASGNSQKKEGGGSGISGGAIAGIVVGVVVGVGAVAGIIAFILIRRKKDEFYSPQSSPSRFNDSGGFHSGYNPSYPVIDQRLNPDLLGGDHRISIASLVDARDYSRQILKVVNPDDEKY